MSLLLQHSESARQMNKQLPNILSLSRIIATSIIVFLILYNTQWSFLLALVMFILAALTDYFDGYFARRLHAVSSLGVFLDLISDKILVSGIFIAMVQIQLVPAWIVIVIICREFFVMGLRSVAAGKGKIIPAGIWGKQKTFITFLAIMSLLTEKSISINYASLIFMGHAFSLISGIAVILLYLALLWTIASGIEYFKDGWKVFSW